jgi:hypothetical protein
VKVKHPVYLAVVGSGNASCSTTAARVCKQYSKQDICFVETIVGMTEMIEQLLDYNHQVNQRLPNRIVFYRDGKIFVFFYTFLNKKLV